MRIKWLSISLISLVVIIFFSGYCLAQQRTAPLGGAIGSIFADELVSPKDSSPSTPKAPAAALSDLVGMYVMQSFTITYQSGTVIRSSNYSFYGDMAITSHSSAWQRIVVTGFDTIVASGSITVVNSNTVTMLDDYEGTSSTANYTWDGTYLTTSVHDVTAPDPYTEVDVWKRILSTGSGANKTIVIPMF
jgi:hypothetical protein